MSQTTSDMARNTSDTAQAAEEMKRIALQGKAAIDTTAGELKRFAGMVMESTGKIENLGHKSEEISGIVTLIKEIADQTNLLALNAAIEAARVGEMGRGFAVVADNVRHLAERTTNAAGEISQRVGAIQTEVMQTVHFMKDNNESVKNIIERVDGALKSIDEIAAYVGQVTEMVQRIAVATEEQSSTAEGVTRNMEGIALVTRQLNNAVGEIKLASEGLSGLAGELNSMVGWFKV